MHTTPHAWHTQLVSTRVQFADRVCCIFSAALESSLHQTWLQCCASSVCRWPRAWTTSAGRPLSTETWPPGTSSSHSTRPARCREGRDVPCYKYVRMSPRLYGECDCLCCDVLSYIIYIGQYNCCMKLQTMPVIMYGQAITTVVTEHVCSP